MASDSARTALQIADWRRRVFALYDAVRAQDDPEEAHELWRIERDDLMARHPATPLLEPDRLLFEGLTIAPYDAAWRYELPILPAEPGDSSSRPQPTGSSRSSGSESSRFRMPELSTSGA